MMKSNGKLILKVKKKRASLPPEKFHKEIKEDKENVKNKSYGKRTNPFTNPKDDTPRKTRKKSDDEIFDRNSFFRRRSYSQGKNLSSSSLEIPLNISSQDDVIISPKREQQLREKINEIKFKGVIFPLNWSLFEKVKFVSSNYFACLKDNIKPADESKGIRNFVENRDCNRSFCDSIYNWVFPFIPGLSSYPIRKKITGTLIKDETEINLLSNNRPFQEVIMREWRTSFQSLFAMLKTDHCPYFYLCSYQFTILFKAGLVAKGGLEAVITPSTKGLRNMLAEEGVEFDFPYCDDKKTASKTISFSDNDDVISKDLDASLNDSGNNEAFLDSIGLDKKTHFPNMLEHQRLVDTSKSRKFDQGLESTIRVRGCQSLFNFLLNSKFLCAPSGNMFGIPPTLISPAPFQNASLQRCKFTYTDVKVLSDGVYSNRHCLEMHGPILPTQITSILDSLGICDHDNVQIQGKLYASTIPLNIPSDQVELTHDQCRKCGLKSTDIPFFKQNPVQLPANFEVEYCVGVYTVK